MGATGTTTIDFGAFPGKTDVSVAVTGQTGILTGSVVGAWLVSAASADHSADEHTIDGPFVIAGNIVAGTGFTIYAVAPPYPPQPDDVTGYDNQGANESPNNTKVTTRTTPMIYGVWNVAWAWA